MPQAGRRVLALIEPEAAGSARKRVGFLEAEGMAPNHIMPHGVPYGMAARDAEVANAICDAATVYNKLLLGMKGKLHETVYPGRGQAMIPEFYADLDYNDDGLIITRAHDAEEPQQAAAKCVRAVAEGKVRSVDAQTICAHSGTPNAQEIAAAVRAAIPRHRR